MKRHWSLGLAATLAASLSPVAWATVPYTPVALPPGAVPGIGPGVIDVKTVFGKEYSHDLDESTTLGGGTPDPDQVIAWDGIGGAADGLDFSGTRVGSFEEGQIDAVANHADALFGRLREDRAHLIFSHDDMISVYPGAGAGFVPAVVPSAGPIPVLNGSLLGGAGELSVEEAGVYAPPSTQGLWAAQASINAMPLPVDVDGVEVWGPEPALAADTDKYSLQIDAFTDPTGGPGVSIWNGSGTPYLPHSTVVAAVTSLLGAVPGSAVLPYDNFIEGEAAINLDALMVHDVVGENETFDRDPTGAPGDQIIFSIQQIPNPADPDGYYATGSELFVLDATLGPAGTTYLAHGGHLWDHGYALSDLVVSPNLVDGYGVIDINAIEAVGELIVPEPTALVLMVACFGGAAMMRQRLG